MEGRPDEILLALALAKGVDGERRHVPDRRARIDRRQQTAPPPRKERRSGPDRRRGLRRRREMPSRAGSEIRQTRAEFSGHSREEKQAALEATEQILVSLRREPNPDFALRELIQSIEDEQAILVASLLDGRGRGPAGRTDR
jgi:hypothetical protein